MTLRTEQNRTRRLRAPQENRTAVVDPAWDKVSDLIEENVSLRTQPDYDFQGRTLADLTRQARSELLAAAHRWTTAYRNAAPLPDDPLALIFLAGHQPQMFHPGVLFKNFAVGRLAHLHQATAINLIIDSDVITNASLRVPAGSAHQPQVVLEAFDRQNPRIPYEERRIEDRALFDSFARRVQDKIAALVQHPLMEKYWPMVLRRSQDTDRLGDCLAQARHLIEEQWGLMTLEIPQSRVCALESFHWLVAHIVAQLPGFSAVYNQAVREHRRLQRIRNASHPVPDLAVDGDWLEAPFWIWSREDPRRKHLFVQQRPNELILSDRHDIEARLPLTDQSDAARAAEQLAELERGGVKIRSRALLTTLWARLVLGDLFIHGIGGGNYDHVTDRIIERFFQRKPPGFMVLSATLHLPIERIAGKLEDPATIDRQLREMTYHPEKYLNGVFDQSQGAPDEVQAMIDTKRKWIETPQTRENARMRCRSIRQVNESLHHWLAERRRELLDRRAQATVQLQAERILTWREYAFCLYPEETLRSFLDSLLPR